MYKTLTVFLFSFILLSLDSYAWPCKDGSGQVETYNRNLSDFNKVIIKGSGTLKVKQSNNFKVQITVDDNLIELIESKINNGILVIQPKKEICPSKYVIMIEIPEVEALGVKGSGEIISIGKIKSEELKIRIDGSGDINMDLDVKDLSLKINGSGDMDVRGQAGDVQANINGSGDINMFDCICDNFNIEVNGSGDALIHSKGAINVLIRGSGDVTYKGSPEELDVEIYGSGELKKIKR